MTKGERDVEKFYSTGQIVAKLRRLADALEHEKAFTIQIAGERIRVPKRAEFSIEHEREEDSEEIEFQFTWTLDADAPDDDDDDDDDLAV
jgi:amphi-Trp domain-containing protein